MKMEDIVMGIFNESIEGSSVFLVETGESRTPSYRTISNLLVQRQAFAICFCTQ